MTVMVRPRSKSHWLSVGVALEHLVLVARRDDGVDLYVPSWPKYLPAPVDRTVKVVPFRRPSLSEAESALLRFIAADRGL